MRLFDSNTQETKYKVLKEVAKSAFEDTLNANTINQIPKKLVASQDQVMRCCIYKERAVVGDMVNMAMGGDKSNPNIMEVLDSACDACPINKYTVSEACRGCITHKCVEGCPVGAISISKNKHAYIDQEKCIECGKCYKACPYSAIRENVRPCVQSCKINAISVNVDRKAKIDQNKCVMCGACMTKCPFGAIQDKSFILETVQILKDAQKNDTRAYAIIAPAIVSQFKYAKIGQVITGIKKLGFHNVVEVALGADIVACKEAEELLEKGKLLSSCCPSFKLYVEKAYPQLAGMISGSVSPMVETARLIKKTDANAKVVFIGPCTSKKFEFKREEVKGDVDSVITFEELQALLDSRGIHSEELEESVLDNASYYGRIFARSGGVSEALTKAVENLGADIEVKAVKSDGLDQCKINLLKMSKNLMDCNFIEGMACSGGCINGAACLSHDKKDADDVDHYGRSALEADMRNSLALYEMSVKDEK